MAVQIAEMVDEYAPFDFFDVDRAETVMRSIFSTYDEDDNGVDDMKELTVKYLLIEFCLESFPQIVIQVINNQLGKWSIVGYISLVFSLYIAVNTLYKYGCERCYTVNIPLPLYGRFPGSRTALHASCM